MPALPSFDTAVFSWLDADAGLEALVSNRIYNLQAPPGVGLPYLIYYLASGLIPNLTPRDDVNYIYRLDAVATTRAAAEAIHQAVYACLHEQSVTVAGWSNYWLACERVTPITENVEGTTRWRYISDYRLKASISS